MMLNVIGLFKLILDEAKLYDIRRSRVILDWV